MKKLDDMKLPKNFKADKFNYSHIEKIKCNELKCGGDVQFIYKDTENGVYYMQCKYCEKIRIAD